MVQVGNEAAGSIVFHGDSRDKQTAVPGEKDGGQQERAMGRKARRLLRKKERREKRLLKNGNSTKASAAAGKGSSGESLESVGTTVVTVEI